jgi:hypothetical protein
LVLSITIIYYNKPPNGLALSRVAQLLPESILTANKERHLNHFSPRLATSAAAPGWAASEIESIF